MNVTDVGSSLQTLPPPWQTHSLSLPETETTEADELLCLMEQAARQTLRTQRLQNLLAWASQIADRSKEPAHPAAKRAAAISLVLERAILLAHAHARGADRTSALKLSDTLSHALEHTRTIIAKLKQRIESVSAPQVREFSREFMDQVTQSWFEGQFDPTLIELTQAEAQDLNRYLSASEWMVQCIETPVGISCGVWDAIVDRLIQPSR